MNHDYGCIRERIDEPPSWWDEHAVPRYAEFGPRETANIYATECCLLLIACQNCALEFRVCLSQSISDRWIRGSEGMRPALSELVETDELHYGDPPNIGCCAAGPTMNSIPLRVLEFWRRAGFFEWERVERFEVTLDPEWAR